MKHDSCLALLVCDHVGILENMTFKISFACDQFFLDTIINCFEQKLIRGSNLTSGLTLRAPLAIISMTLSTFKGDKRKV